MSVNLPKTSSAYAVEGTAAHELGETCLRTGENAINHVGGCITVDGAVIEVTDEMATAVQVYLNVIREDLAAAGPGAELIIEKQFHLDWLYPGLFGTLDAMICQPFGTARCYDYKHGMGVAVEVEDNPQLLYYTTGGTHGQGYEKAEIVVIQPRAPHPDGPVRRQDIDLQILHDWAYNVLLPGAQATEAPDASLNEGKHCRFCPALAVCPKQRDKAMEVAKEVFGSSPKPLPGPGAMTNAQLCKALEAADMVEAWFNACRMHVRTLLEAGQVTPEEVGHKLVQGRASRSWTNEEEAKTWLEALIGDEAYITKLVSPSQAEKVLKGPGKKALAEMVSVNRGVQMVHISDSREAIAPPPMLFDEVE